MKILQINAVLEYGSTGRNATDLSEMLKKSGHESWIAYSKGNRMIPNTYHINNEFDTKFHGLMSRIFGLQGYFSYFPTIRLIKFIKKKKFDVINLGNLHGNFINIPMLFRFLVKENIPTVIILHDCFLYTGKCCHYTVDNCFKWQTECGNCPRIKKDNKSYFFDCSKKMFKMKKQFYEKCNNLAVIGVSEWITREAEKSILKNAKIIKKIFNWVDLAAFKPSSINYRKKFNIEDKFVILGVAPSWSTAKGINDFENLSRIIPGDWVILLVGDNKKPIKSLNVISIAQTKDISELVGYYNTADVFVNFSREESFGKVTAEALSCGVPAIVPGSTANPELIGDGCGYVVAKTDAAEYMEYLKKINSNGKGSYTHVCRSFAEQHFDEETNLQKYLEVFLQISER